MRKLILLSFIALLTRVPVEAQVEASQSQALVTLERGAVSQGDSFVTTVDFGKPWRCQTSFNIYFTNGNPQGSFELAGNGNIGTQASASTTISVPRDAPAGTYTATNIFVYPCPGYSARQVVSLTKPQTVVVNGTPDIPAEPTVASASISFTKRQFLNTEILGFQSIEQDVTGRLNHATDGAQERAFLLQQLLAGDKLLMGAEANYKEYVLKQKESMPAFFADLHSQFRDRMIEVRAPSASVANRTAPNARVLYVAQELKPRSGQQREFIKPVLFPLAAVVVQLLRDSASVLKYVRDTGRITFDVRLASRPNDAHMKYWKLIEPTLVLDYGRQTDIDRATFELATWVFQFSSSKCTDKPEIMIDPYQDTKPDFTVEFRNCKVSR